MLTGILKEKSYLNTTTDLNSVSLWGDKLYFREIFIYFFYYFLQSFESIVIVNISSCRKSEKIQK